MSISKNNIDLITNNLKLEFSFLPKNTFRVFINFLLINYSIGNDNESLDDYILNKTYKLKTYLNSKNNIKIQNDFESGFTLFLIAISNNDIKEDENYDSIKDKIKEDKTNSILDILSGKKESIHLSDNSELFEINKLILSIKNSTELQKKIKDKLKFLLSKITSKTINKEINSQNKNILSEQVIVIASTTITSIGFISLATMSGLIAPLIVLPAALSGIKYGVQVGSKISNYVNKNFYKSSNVDKGFNKNLIFNKKEEIKKEINEKLNEKNRIDINNSLKPEQTPKINNANKSKYR